MSITKRNYKKIDLEHHFYDICAIDAFAARAAEKNYPYYDRGTDTIHWMEGIPMPQGKLLETLLDVSEARLARMDRCGVDCAVLSCSPGVEELDEATCIDVCRRTNDAIYAVMQTYPGRFYGSAVLPAAFPEAAVAELERCVKEYGFVAWHAHSNFAGKSPDLPEFFPIFQKAAELGVYVYLHPQLSSYDRLKGFGFTAAGPALGFTVNTTITITRMILGGLFDKLPNLKVVLGHLGEGIPFLLDRMDNRIQFLPNSFIKNQHPFRYYFQNNIWLTTSGNMSKEAFRCTMDVMGMDHILLGTDFPFEQLEEMTEFLDSLPLTEAQFRQMYRDNAIQFLGLPENP